MESSISHYFNIMGVAQIRPLADYIFYSSKATMHIYSHTKFELSVLITSWRMRGSQNPRWRRGCAHAPPNGKIFYLLKLLIISIHVRNFSFLTQLLCEIWSPLFAIGLTLATEMVLGFFPLDLGFLVSSGFLGIFGFDKIWVSEAVQFFFAAFYYQFTDDTKFHGNETAVVMLFILLLFHLFCTTSAFSLLHWDPADT